MKSWKYGFPIVTDHIWKIFSSEILFCVLVLFHSHQPPRINLYQVWKKKLKILFDYQKALIRTFHISFWLQNKLCEFTTGEHKFKIFVLLKIGFKHLFKIFLIFKTKLILLIWIKEYIDLDIIKNVSSSTSKKNSVFTSFREFKKILPNTFIYESILIKLIWLLTLCIHKYFI